MKHFHILTFSCSQAYYGGEARCDVEMGENFNPEELVCGGCSDIAKAQVGSIKLLLNQLDLIEQFSPLRCAQNTEWISSNTNAGTAVQSPFSSALEQLTSVTRVTMTSSG